MQPKKILGVGRAREREEKEKEQALPEPTPFVVSTDGLYDFGTKAFLGFFITRHFKVSSLRH